MRPAGTVALLLAVIAPLTLSGLGVYQQRAGGDWLEEVHEFFGNGMLALVLAHIGVVLGLSLLRRRNLVAPMLTGRTAGAGPRCCWWRCWPSGPGSGRPRRRRAMRATPHNRTMTTMTTTIEVLPHARAAG